MTAITRNFLTQTDLNREEFIDLIDHAIRLKDQTQAGVCPQPLAGKAVGLIFHKPSLRTRISFEVGVQQLGGNALFVTDKEIQLGVRETIADAARVLSRYLSMIVIRTFHQQDIEELAKYADIPVINALTDLVHPCQVFCDLLTIKEKLGRIEDIKVAYFGDGNNMARSWINAAHLLDIDLWIATTPDTHPGEEFVAKAMDNAVGKVTITEDPSAAAKDADVLYTDVWASMGEKDKAVENAIKLEKMSLNEERLAEAKPSCIVMHCLPAERGREISEAVIDGPNSVVFDQAENRLHGQKSIMLRCLGYN
ncbi:MAG: ornithine carbamoyltransferase [Candidatus Hatepunaea meridiana]|nr:ornithine carbamoyltransferase [Candidatus Hatepunaea meridiana]